MKFPAFIRELVGSLDKEQIPYVVLRNAESLPITNISNDIDVLVEKAACQILLQVIDRTPDVYIVSVTKRTYVHNYYLGNIVDGARIYLQLDFIFRFEWLGLEYLSPRAILQEGRKRNGILQLSEIHQLAIVLVSKFVIHGFLKPEYINRIHRILEQDRENFTICLRQISTTEVNMERFLQLFSNTEELTRDFYKHSLVSGTSVRKRARATYSYAAHLIREACYALPFRNRQFLFIEDDENPERIKDDFIGAASQFIIVPHPNSLVALHYLIKPCRSYTMIFFGCKRVPLAFALFRKLNSSRDAHKYFERLSSRSSRRFLSQSKGLYK